MSTGWMAQWLGELTSALAEDQSSSLSTCVADACDWSTRNKDSETDIGVQVKGQKSETASHRFLPLPQIEMGFLSP